MHCNPTLSNSDKKKTAILVIVCFTHIFRKKKKKKLGVWEYLSIHRCVKVLLPVQIPLTAKILSNGGAWSDI